MYDGTGRVVRIPEDGAAGWRRMPPCYDRWNTAHFAFVHAATFGDMTQPKPRKYEIAETE